MLYETFSGLLETCSVPKWRSGHERPTFPQRADDLAPKTAWRFLNTLCETYFFVDSKFQIFQLTEIWSLDPIITACWAGCQVRVSRKNARRLFRQLVPLAEVLGGGHHMGNPLSLPLSPSPFPPLSLSLSLCVSFSVSFSFAYAFALSFAFFLSLSLSAASICPKQSGKHG